MMEWDRQSDWQIYCQKRRVAVGVFVLIVCMILIGAGFALLTR